MDFSNAQILMKSYLKYLVVILAGTILLLFINFTLVNTKVIVIEDWESNEKHTVVVKDREFTLKYIHSVQKTPVYEFFKITQDNKLVLVETTFSSLGVGLPFTEENGGFQNDSGVFRLSGLNREFADISIRVSPIPEHSIIVGEKAYPLLKFVREDHLAKITAADRWMLVRRSKM